MLLLGRRLLLYLFGPLLRVFHGPFGLNGLLWYGGLGGGFKYVSMAASSSCPGVCAFSPKWTSYVRKIKEMGLKGKPVARPR